MGNGEFSFRRMGLILNFPIQLQSISVLDERDDGPIEGRSRTKMSPRPVIWSGIPFDGV